MKFVSFVRIIAVLLLSTSLVVAEDGSSDPPEVTVAQGKLQGLKYRSRKGSPYFGFLGVPYGKASVRFGPPQPADSWTGTKVATKFPPQCYQFCLVQQRLTGNEDCLTLNIYTKNVKGNAPVMVLLHGGGFQFGTGNFHEAAYFMDENVVLVSIQYRLGALGFLNFEDDTVTANNGLRDQSFALRWVQENVANFGGDPTKVNIFGYSAGGASVHYQMLSPMSKGLFSTAISQSGTSLSPWAFQKKPKKLALALAENVGCTRETTEEIVECLRSKPPSEIVNGQLKFAKFPFEFDLISMLFSPSVDHGTKEPKFLPDTPYKLVERDEVASKVPWIAGVTRDEGALYIAGMVEHDKSIDILNSDYYKMAPYMLYYENSAPVSAQKSIAEKIWKFYIGAGEKAKTDDFIQLGRLFGDRFFVTPVSRGIREHAKKASFPIYAYIFSRDAEHSTTHGFLYAKNKYGVAHADELKYLFNRTYGSPDYPLDTEDGKFSEKLMKLFTSFARDGKPTSTWGANWEPLKLSGDDDTIKWYDINDDTQVLSTDPFKERTDFWEGLPLKELEKEDYPDEKDEL